MLGWLLEAPHQISGWGDRVTTHKHSWETGTKYICFCHFFILWHFMVLLIFLFAAICCLPWLQVTWRWQQWTIPVQCVLKWWLVVSTGSLCDRVTTQEHNQETDHYHPIAGSAWTGTFMAGSPDTILNTCRLPTVDILWQGGPGVEGQLAQSNLNLKSIKYFVYGQL